MLITSTKAGSPDIRHWHSIETAPARQRDGTGTAKRRHRHGRETAPARQRDGTGTSERRHRHVRETAPARKRDGTGTAKIAPTEMLLSECINTARHFCFGPCSDFFPVSDGCRARKRRGCYLVSSNRKHVALTSCRISSRCQLLSRQEEVLLELALVKQKLSDQLMTSALSSASLY